MSLCLSSFWVVWPHRHKFSPPYIPPSTSLLLSSGTLAKQIPPYLLSQPVCKLSFQFLSFPAARVIPPPLFPCCFYLFGHSSSPPSLHPSAFPSPSLFVYSKPTQRQGVVCFEFLISCMHRLQMSVHRNGIYRWFGRKSSVVPFTGTE